MKKMSSIICLVINQPKFVHEMVPRWLKNRDQRVDRGGLI